MKRAYRDSYVLDVGAGTAQVSIETALGALRPCICIERFEKGIELIKANAEKIRRQ